MSDISTSYDLCSAQEMDRLKTTIERANLAANAFLAVAVLSGMYAYNQLNTDDTPQVDKFSHSFSLTR